MAVRGKSEGRNGQIKPLDVSYVDRIFNLKQLKAHANGRNKSQHCCALLGVFGQQCCVRLKGP